MARPLWRRNSKTIERILKTKDAPLKAAAAVIVANIDDDQLVRIDEYVTDRKVVGIVVAADAQARDGVATKAASAAGISPGKP